MKLSDFKIGQKILIPVDDQNLYMGFTDHSKLKNNQKYLEGTIIFKNSANVLIGWKKDDKRISGSWNFPVPNHNDGMIMDAKFDDYIFAYWIGNNYIAKSKENSTSFSFPLLLSAAAIGLFHLSTKQQTSLEYLNEED